MINGFWQKIGVWPTNIKTIWQNKTNWIWFHAVSVGEINAIWPLLLEIHNDYQIYPIMVSTTTKRGYEQAKKLIKNKDITLFYFPFDLPNILTKLLNLARVKIVIIAETEIWPITLLSCKKKDIPVVLINGRLSDKSFKRYSLFKPFVTYIINLFTTVIAQSKSDGSKFKSLGLRDEKLKIYGNIKFSSLNTNLATQNQNINYNNLVKIIFASTHKGEDEIAISIYKQLINEYPNIRLIIAPRHIERVFEISELLKKAKRMIFKLKFMTF